MNVEPRLKEAGHRQTMKRWQRPGEVLVLDFVKPLYRRSGIVWTEEREQTSL
jgi:hypothetical protein